MSVRENRGRIAPVLVRASAVVPLAPGIVALLVVNTLLRGHRWDHEWGWAIYQAGFVTVFLGPLCAGIGVWDGAQLARAEPTIESAGRASMARAGAWAAITGVVCGTYLIFLFVLGVVLKTEGILDWPGIVDLSPIPGVLALCSAWSAIGVGAGYRWRTPLLAPIVTVAAFGLTLVLYLVQPFLIRVGGATASILFLEPRGSIQLGQIILFGAISAAAIIGLPVSHAAREPRSRMAWRCVAPAAAILAAGYLVTAPGIELVDRHRQLVCQGDQPQICVASPYRDRARRLARYLTPYLVALSDVGITPPATFSQSPTRPVGEGSIPDEVLLGQPPINGTDGSMGPGGAAVLGAFLPDFCDIYAHPSVAAAYNTATLWLTSLTSPEVLEDPSTPDVLRSGDKEAKGAYLRSAFDELVTCPT